jgi:hypothetical protein
VGSADACARAGSAAGQIAGAEGRFLNSEIIYVAGKMSPRTVEALEAGDVRRVYPLK